MTSDELGDLTVTDIRHDEIEPNPSNPNEMDASTMIALRDDIDKRGFVQPVLVRPIGQIAGEKSMHVAECPMTKPDAKDRYTCVCQHYDDDPRLTPEGGVKYRIIDGEHRWRVLGELGAETVPCVVDETNATDAEVRMLTMNRLRGSFVPIKLAHMLADLASRTEPKDIQKRLGMDAKEMKNLLDLGDYLEPPAPKEDSDPPEPLPPTLAVTVVATPEQATAVRRLLGTDDEEAQTELIRHAATGK